MEKVALEAGLNAVYDMIQEQCLKAAKYIQGRDKHHRALNLPVTSTIVIETTVEFHQRPWASCLPQRFTPLTHQ